MCGEDTGGPDDTDDGRGVFGTIVDFFSGPGLSAKAAGAGPGFGTRGPANSAFGPTGRGTPGFNPSATRSGSGGFTAESAEEAAENDPTGEQAMADLGFGPEKGPSTGQQGPNDSRGDKRRTQSQRTSGSGSGKRTSTTGVSAGSTGGGVRRRLLLGGTGVQI